MLEATLLKLDFTALTQGLMVHGMLELGGDPACLSIPPATSTSRCSGISLDAWDPDGGGALLSTTAIAAEADATPPP